MSFEHQVDTWDYSYKPNYQVFNTAKSYIDKNPNRKRVDNLLSMRRNANTTSLLNNLEEYRKDLSDMSFRSLLLSLTTGFNDKWTQSIPQRESFARHSKQRILTQDDINHCSLVVLYYIVTVIKKYQITDVDPIWTQILNNSVAQTITFYRFLYKNKIIISDEICTSFSEKLQTFYSNQLPEDKIKLILLGFCCKSSTTRFMRIKHWEELFAEAKQQQLYYKKLSPQLLISSMTTPELLSLFLSHFSNYDLSTIDKKTGYNVLDQIIAMKPYFYLASGDKRQAIYPVSELSLYSNETNKYRAVRILNLLRSVILQGAQLSESFFINNTYRTMMINRFYTTSIGIYALIGLRMDDIYPSKSSWERDSLFISNITTIVKRHPPEFENFILHYLSSSYSIIHKKEFIIQQRTNENIQTQNIHDKLFQTTLTLKEWCRLKIKDVCTQKNVNKLNLSNSLIDYCSFGLLSPKYASKCISEVTEHKGNIMLNHARVENPATVLSETDDDDENSAISINSFDESDEY